MSGTIAFPPNPTVGQTYQFGGSTWVWNGTVWTIAGAAGSSFIVVGPTAPAATNTGQLWWNTTDGQLYIWSGADWVVANNPPGPNPADYVQFASGGTMTAPLALQGVTDGSNAAAGKVGEYISNTGTVSSGITAGIATAIGGPITLTPGDWDVSGLASLTAASGGSLQTWIDGTGSSVPTGANLLSTGLTTSTIGGGATNSSCIPISSLRRNVTASTQLWMWVQLSAGGTQNMSAIWARRVR